MKCPHCGKYVPMEIDQEPVRLPGAAAERWPLAREFLALVQAFDGNMIDATLLCLLVEDQQSGHRASYRELAGRSGGMFAMRVVSKGIERLAQQGVLTVGDGKNYQVDIGVVGKLIADAPRPMDALFLALKEIAGGDFRDALVLYLLIKAGADKVPTKLTGGDVIRHADGLYAHPKEPLRSLRRHAPFRGGGLLRQDAYRYWIVDSGKINALLAQRMAEWSARGSPDEPWAHGLRLALAAGSIPGASAGQFPHLGQ